MLVTIIPEHFNFNPFIIKPIAQELEVIRLMEELLHHLSF